MTHELKCWTRYFEAISRGNMTDCLRTNNRDYKFGDMLLLSEFEPETQAFTGRTVLVHVTHLIADGPHVPGGEMMVAIWLRINVNSEDSTMKIINPKSAFSRAVRIAPPWWVRGWRWLRDEIYWIFRI